MCMCVRVGVCICVYMFVSHVRWTISSRSQLFLTMGVPRLNSDCHVLPSAFPVEATSLAHGSPHVSRWRICFSPILIKMTGCSRNACRYDVALDRIEIVCSVDCSWGKNYWKAICFASLGCIWVSCLLSDLHVTIHLRLHGKGNLLCSLGFLPTFFLLFMTISAPESQEMTAMTFAKLSKR